MGVHTHRGTMPGAVTPICNECGVSLCWDVGEDEYKQQAAFWNDWICKDCNGGESLSLTNWNQKQITAGNQKIPLIQK